MSSPPTSKDENRSNHLSRTRMKPCELPSSDHWWLVLRYRAYSGQSALFVTWNTTSHLRHSQKPALRGCIGNFSPMPLAKGLREYALVRWASASVLPDPSTLKLSCSQCLGRPSILAHQSLRTPLPLMQVSPTSPHILPGRSHFATYPILTFPASPS